MCIIKYRIFSPSTIVNLLTNFERFGTVDDTERNNQSLSSQPTTNSQL